MLLRILWDVGVALTCLQLLLLLLSGVEPRPHAWDGDRPQLEALKKGILERLGMSAPPTLRHRPDPESIRRAQRLYQQKVAELARNRSRELGEEEEEEEEEEGAVPGTRRRHRLTPTLLRPTDVPGGQQDPHGPYRYHLILSRSRIFHRRIRVAKAELQLLKRPLTPSPSASQLTAPGPPRVSVYRLGGAPGTPRVVQSQELDPDAPSLDLTAAIRPWAAGPEDTLRLELVFTANASALPGTPGVLGVETLETPSRGARRARGLEEECRKSDGKCCLKSLKVSFQDIGWSDWVIAPNSYYMRFCEGSCPHNYKPASMHAQIKARLHSLSRATPPPCCVPAGYDPMVLMHYDDQGRLVSTLFEDMLVTRCHCA